jgi:RNA polymerase sigma-70 factor (ECF subfamily)
MTEKEFKAHLLPMQSKLFRLAVTMVGSRAEAEDLVQDVYLKLWNMRSELSEYKSVEALAVTMTKNLCIDKLRSYRSRNRNEGRLEQVSIPSETNDPERSFELKESLQQVQEIMQRLPDKQRYILHLREVEQYSYDEIGEITGLTRNNIRVTLSRARKRVRKEYLKRQNYDNRRN